MAETEAPPRLVPEVPTIARARAAQADPFDRLWRLLSSVRFAILLLALAAGGVLAGTLIMQAPAETAANPDAFAAWLARPRDRYGEPWATVFAWLDLYRVFSSFWFRALLAVLTLAVVVCTINRLPGIAASIRRPAVQVPQRLFERAPLRAEFGYVGVSPEQAQLQAEKVFGARRYRTIPWRDGEAYALFADKNRFGKLGTFLNHLGIVIILGAGVLGGVFGWREDGFMVPEGSIRAVGHGTGLTVRNDGFTDEYYPSGTAKDFRSDLVLMEHGREVARKTIRVNDPLEYKGVRFHQAFFGPAAVMRVADAEGRTVFEDGVSLGYEFTGGGVRRNGGFFVLGNRRLAVYVIAPAAQRGPDPDIPAGTVRLELFEPRQPRPSAIETLPQGTPREILGYTFEFVRERQFSGLQVAYNPAVNVLWVAAACMVLGTLAVFHFPLRRVWLRAEPLTAHEGRRTDDESGATYVLRPSSFVGRASAPGVRLRLAAVSNRDVLFAREFEALALALDDEIAQLSGLAPPAPAAPPHMSAQVEA
jgi:cytochrome c biogenesis protein